MERVRKSRSGGGSKLNRSAVVTIRLDPKLRYLTELAARKQRRTVSSFIEWAVEQALYQVELTIADNGTRDVVSAARWLWMPHEADRLVRLGLYCPDLLTFDEQLVWQLIQECAGLWGEVTYPTTAPDAYAAAFERDKALNYPKLRAHWEDVKKVAAGEADMSILPKDVVDQGKP